MRTIHADDSSGQYATCGKPVMRMVTPFPLPPPRRARAREGELTRASVNILQVVSSGERVTLAAVAKTVTSWHGFKAALRG